MRTFIINKARYERNTAGAFSFKERTFSYVTKTKRKPDVV